MITIPTSLYIHFPWCIRKCNYCDFNSYAMLPNPQTQVKYINALVNDFNYEHKIHPRHSLVSIFLGGGTPSLFHPHYLGTLLNKINKIIRFEKNIEITLEANPGTFDLKKLTEFRALGINRLSLGIQSFQADKLKTLGRIHDAATAHQAITIARKARFTNLNLDLMYNLPHQTVTDACFDLKTASAFNPTHISWYQLTIEPNTPFGTNPPRTPQDTTCAQIETNGYQLLAHAGYQRYETSNYAQQNYECQHNLNYWQFGDYFGIGAGAHGKLTNLTTHAITRTQKPLKPHIYLNSKPTELAHTTKIPTPEIPLEFMLNALRLTTAIPINLFTNRTGLSLATIEPQLQHLIKQGVMQKNSSGFRLTPKGQKFLNQCLEVFV